MTNLLMVGTMSNNLHTSHTHTARYTCMWHHTANDQWAIAAELKHSNVETRHPCMVSLWTIL